MDVSYHIILCGKNINQTICNIIALVVFELAENDIRVPLMYSQHN